MLSFSRKKLVSTQRKVLRMVTRAYITVPTDALQVLFGQMQPNLELWEKVSAYCTRKGKYVCILHLVVPGTNGLILGVRIDAE